MDLEALHLEVFWFQSHVCELIDDRKESEARRCFDTIQRLLLEGDDEVRRAVIDHFAVPHLFLHSDLDWAMERMPPAVAKLVDVVKRFHEKLFSKHRE